ncbi:GNAT family N-acetyltransferase [Kribbella sandramycini]|uniref:GNAT family N-acetyltransferase n=1 Tax=Kribbella sandramycini TaxID=60450 RepID=A0A7Y4KYT4_9ACTN|nr:GNAT family N-acetyltransferase [Kribbella sandramycini]MBB6568987.1 GNAT superfamily N-acetyltransferase [Kribbella sandramycini]NOL41168.1 GNAT family N-acetyltransferase [Kribbella sandramycini]
MEFTTRPATLDDAHPIYELMAAAEVSWHGQAEVVPDSVAADLRRPLIDLALDTLVVEAPGGELAGWAWVHDGKRSQAGVHPAYRGHGLGPRLLDWIEARSRAVGSEWVAQAVDDADKAGTKLLRTRGAEVLATNWLLERPAAVESRELPDGVRLDAYDPERAQEAHELIGTAFSAFQSRRKSFEEWSELTVLRSTFLPAATTFAYVGDELAGVVIALDGEEGYVEQLAVSSDHRGRGIARAMLDRTSAEFARLGRDTIILWTHSGTGALAMYEHLGLRARRSTTVHRLTF